MLAMRASNDGCVRAEGENFTPNLTRFRLRPEAFPTLTITSRNVLRLARGAAPGHRVLRAAKALHDMIEGRPTEERLIV
jgi:hypothetical protein